MFRVCHSLASGDARNRLTLMSIIASSCCSGNHRLPSDAFSLCVHDFKAAAAAAPAAPAAAAPPPNPPLAPVLAAAAPPPPVPVVASMCRARSAVVSRENSSGGAGGCGAIAGSGVGRGSTTVPVAVRVVVLRVSTVPAWLPAGRTSKDRPPCRNWTSIVSPGPTPSGTVISLRSLGSLTALAKRANTRSGEPPGVADGDGGAAGAGGAVAWPWPGRGVTVSAANRAADPAADPAAVVGTGARPAAPPTASIVVCAAAAGDAWSTVWSIAPPCSSSNEQCNCKHCSKCNGAWQRNLPR